VHLLRIYLEANSRLCSEQDAAWIVVGKKGRVKRTRGKILARPLYIKIDDLKGREIQVLLKEHFEEMHQNSPPDSCHVLELEQLRKPDITFWSAWSDGGELLGCGALKELDSLHGEIKSMRTVTIQRGRGVATALLSQILNEAKRRNYKRVSLETGSMDSFVPARNLYAKFGFKECPPFGDYVEDPYSTFMTREI
jgi:putative acetyltransferase